MREQGRNPFKGTDYQTLAALSLFLQHLKDPNFSYIQLETDLVDFKLVFKDYRKIFCEARDRTSLRNRDVEIIIEKMNEQVVAEHDEILIVCRKSNVDLVELVRSHISKNKTSEAEFELWSRLKIWEQTSANLEQAVYILFCEAIQFWIPDEYLKEFADRFRLQAFHRGSLRGDIIKRDDFIAAIDSYRLRVKEGGSRFNDRFRTVEEQIDQIISDVEEGKPKSGDFDVATLSQKPNLMFLLLNKLRDQKDIDLFAWDPIWQSCKVFLYPHSLFNVFKANAGTKKNREYMLTFVQQNLNQLNKFYYEAYFEYDLARLLKTIIEKDHSLNYKVLQVIIRQFENYNNQLFYLRDNEDRLHSKSELCSSLNMLWRESSFDLKEQIYDFIVSTFNLVEDGGDFAYYTPDDIFQILKEFLNLNSNRLLTRRFLALKNELTCQYEKFYRLKFGTKYTFDGHDEIGVGAAFWGYEYKAFDKHFIQKTLVPALKNFHSKRRWDFILENCVTKDEEISRDRPDFLNRVAIPFILDEYKMGNPEATRILREFILSEGIPSKGELVYQELLHGDFTDSQKWELTAVTLGRLHRQIPFIERIVAELASHGHNGAIEQLQIWSGEDDYLRRTIPWTSYLIPSIKQLLDSNPHAAMSIFKSHINSSYFVREFDQYHMHELYELFSELIARDACGGWDVWKDLNKQDKLTISQQLLLAGSLRSLSESNNVKAIKKAVAAADAITFDYERFESKFFYPYSRELVLDFVSTCIDKSNLSRVAGLKITKRFIIDSDPNTDNEANDPKGEFNYHAQILDGKIPGSITSVRGRIPWAIISIARVGISHGLGQAIDLTRILTNDTNLYVRQQSCFALEMLARFRYSKTQEGKRFMSNKQAQQIEDLAFDMLNDQHNKKLALQIGMARVFRWLKSINFEHATHAVNYFLATDFEALNEYLQTIIYFAELADNFDQAQRFRFRDIIFELIDNNPKAKPQIAFLLWSLSSEKSALGQAYLDKTLKYLHKISERYDQQAFESIYSLIKDNFQNADNQLELLAIYKKCIAVEYEYLTTHSEYPNRMWAPYYWNGDILGMIFSVSATDFVDVFKTLLNYPIEYNIGNVENAVNLLFNVPKSLKKDVQDIFKKLVIRDPKLREKQKQWDNNNAT